VQIAMDDFGTGYSSLAYLKRFPIDTLKVDRSFIRDIPSDSGEMKITHAIIAMAHSLKLKVVAEGVETADQLRFLQAQRCDAVQGYFLFRPVPEDQVAAVLELNRLDREARLAIPA
jgi:EAL domain-containing protein (putative c-di-GMP-specific phosphodiesterase class I)